ncbi:hypothetical protein [Paenibacillus bouchesdurhonensis]|uniref:hypothetical protein n=1 Tax=Paenibacillus bouchesdurhonensis TaxID=1870990 RepID=UPI000DA60B2F|nr:hypothetical protein [Paenibacillus bouchesdurhonensis]
MDKQRESFLNKRQKLYAALLECAQSQLRVLSSEDMEDRYGEPFLQLTQQWDQICGEIEALDELAGGLTESSIAAIMEDIVGILNLIEQRLHDSVNETGGDMKSVSDRKLMMNAYYGMNRRGQSSLYFDEKK